MAMAVFRRNYLHKTGLINFPKSHVTSNAYRKNSLGIMGGISLTEKRSIQRDKNSIYASILLEAKEKTIANDPDHLDTGEVLTDNFQKSSYTRTLERPVVYNPRNPYDNSCRIAQPQLHVGILAVPQLSPATDAENFQISTVYWEIEYELDVILDFNSTYTAGQLALSPNNVMFYNNIGQGYTAGHTFCGVDDEWRRGKLGNSVQPMEQQPNFTLRRSERLSKNNPKKRAASVTSIVNTLNKTSFMETDYEYISMDDMHNSTPSYSEIDECIEAKETTMTGKNQRTVKQVTK